MTAIEGFDVNALAEAVKTGNRAQVRVILNARPDLLHKDMAENDEHRVLHFAVLGRDAGMVKLLMEAGADAHKGIWPHRVATSALALAREREYNEIVEIIEGEERLRREELSCPNATVSSVQEQIHAAIGAGDRSAAMELLQADPSLIQACDRNGRTPLHAAAGAAEDELVAWLLSRRAKVNQPDIRGLTPLDIAALSVDPRDEDAEKFAVIARHLLGAGAELTVRGAVALGDETQAAEFIEADPEHLREIQSNGGLLTLAVKHGRVGMVRLLLDLGADVDERIDLKQVERPTPSWGMPLWNAALANHYEIAELLLDRGADPNANVYASGWPIRNAWNHRDGRIKRLLLERGAKAHPYMVAENHDVEEARRLLQSDPREEIASELGWSAADHGCAAIVGLALTHLKWAPDDSRWHWMLIQPMRGAGSDASGNAGYFESLQLMLQHGIDPNIARRGETALHFTAATTGGETAVRFASLLIDYGARPDIRDDLLRSTPLGWACRWGRKELVELLLRRGASAREADAEPWASPLAWARKMNYPEIVALLRELIM